jgi:uncharacterized membrane protein
MNRMQILYFISTIYFSLTGYVLATVWWLKISPLRKFSIIVVSILLSPAGFIWYWVEFIIDRKKKKKKKKDEDKDKKEKEETKKEIEEDAS